MLSLHKPRSRRSRRKGVRLVLIAMPSSVSYFQIFWDNRKCWCKSYVIFVYFCVCPLAPVSFWPHCYYCFSHDQILRSPHCHDLFKTLWFTILYMLTRSGVFQSCSWTGVCNTALWLRALFHVSTKTRLLFPTQRVFVFVCFCFLYMHGVLYFSLCVTCSTFSRLNHVQTHRVPQRTKIIALFPMLMYMHITFVMFMYAQYFFVCCPTCWLSPAHSSSSSGFTTFFILMWKMFFRDSDSRILSINVVKDELHFTVITGGNVYAPNSDSDQGLVWWSIEDCTCLVW